MMTQNFNKKQLIPSGVILKQEDNRGLLKYRVIFHDATEGLIRVSLESSAKIEALLARTEGSTDHVQFKTGIVEDFQDGVPVLSLYPRILPDSMSLRL